jgi:hypothetical protein
VRGLILILFLFIYPTAQADDWFDFFRRAELLTGVPAELLYGVAKVESGFGRDPWPWTVGDNGKPLTFYTMDEMLRYLKRRPHDNLDIGVMQVNLRWHGDKIRDLRTIIHPWTNVMIGASILKQCGAGVKPVRSVLACYHGRNDSRYAQKVIAAMKR